MLRAAVLRWAVRLRLRRLAWSLGYLPGCCAYHDPIDRAGGPRW